MTRLGSDGAGGIIEVHSGEPETPQTEAGRQLAIVLHTAVKTRDLQWLRFASDDIDTAVRRIEREAAALAPGAGLDVERLARARRHLVQHRAVADTTLPPDCPECAEAYREEQARSRRQVVSLTPERWAAVLDRVRAEGFAEAAALAPGAGLDVERLADALHDWKQCDFGYCEGRDDHRSDAEGIAAEYQRLGATPDPRPETDPS